jgi:hypothetical protein
VPTPINAPLAILKRGNEGKEGQKYMIIERLQPHMRLDSLSNDFIVISDMEEIVRSLLSIKSCKRLRQKA